LSSVPTTSRRSTARCGAAMHEGQSLIGCGNSSDSRKLERNCGNAPVSRGDAKHRARHPTNMDDLIDDDLFVPRRRGRHRDRRACNDRGRPKSAVRVL
jgi:hypothetical protein